MTGGAAKICASLKEPRGAYLILCAVAFYAGEAVVSAGRGAADGLGGLASAMAFTGHLLAQRPQFTHFAGSIAASAPFISIACLGQAFTQSVQPMQPALHTFFTKGPCSGLLHAT